MTRPAEIVVIGGGVMGMSCAHHLHERGFSVRVLERDGVGQATSTCGAGFIAYWAGGLIRPWGEPELTCERYAISFYSELHAERPTFSFRRSGSLYIAMTARGWDERVRTIAEFPSVPGRRVLDPAEAAEVGVIVRREGIVGGVYDPDPVQLVARDATRALAARLRDRGVPIDERRTARRLIVERGRVKGVDTTSGVVAADAVVLAAGMWTNLLLRPHGIWLPYAPMGAVRITTEPLGLPPTVPMLHVPELGAWLREEAGALVWGAGYEGHHRDAFLDADPPAHLRQLPKDGLWETQRKGFRLSTAIPSLARYRDFTYVEGAPCHTPDLLPLVGPLGAVEQLYVVAGDNEAGVTHAPGIGRALADTIAREPPFIDLDRYRPDRFGSAYRTTREVGRAVGSLLSEIAWAGFPNAPVQTRNSRGSRAVSAPERRVDGS